MSQNNKKVRQHNLYAHWLDGEWLKIAYPTVVRGYGRTMQTIIEGWLKLNALFGNQIVISDVQLTDSPIVINLFANPEFRKYISEDPQFLRLVAKPRDDISDPRLAIATRGLDRVYKQKVWTTSLPGVENKAIREFAKCILDLDKIDSAHIINERSKGPGKIIATYPNQKMIFEGMFYGIFHFTEVTGGPSDAKLKDRPYTDFVIETLQRNKKDKNKSSELEEIWDIVITLVPDEEKRSLRSSLIRVLEKLEPDRQKWPDKHHKIWNTMVHAWNSNIADTLGAKGTSISPLPNAVVHFRGEITNLAGPLVDEKGIMKVKKLKKRYPLPSFDPTQMTWKDVLEAFKRVQNKRAKYQTALLGGDGEAISESSVELINNLADHLSPRTPPFLSFWSWVPIHTIAIALGKSHYTHTAHLVDEFLARSQTGLKKGIVFNTLHGFNQEIIRTLRT
jgi:hypothetical protein